MRCDEFNRDVLIFDQFVESLFELMDALTQRAQTFVNMDQYSKYGIPSEIRALSGVVDVRLPEPESVFGQSCN